MFHRATNRISSLTSSDGMYMSQPNDLDEHIFSFYSNLLISEDQDRSQAQAQFLDLILPTISHSQNSSLNAPIS